MSSTQPNRPLSPHLQVYRWPITMFLSILHRITGFGLTLGLVPFALWIWGLAYDAELYQCMTDLFSMLIGKIALFCWTLAFYFHLGNGLRHLNWDLGKGFEISEATTSSWLVIIFALSLTVFTWAMVLQKVGF